ncbi:MULTISPECIES: DUF1850 domain-containing protein [unclassified Psychrobacter]|uniref:DUF1850 domain-containing protein n=1 Tax=unclassified Psychrobacter TaxID=196806 RepID=UPI0025B3732E|nr:MULTISPECIES: DUF1850 domain-containing protein [unclassified Psychrobacter]MDN3454566.1 DUF1850 domain-containing protein [Psychrobacter sp. APC 3350]MDN3502212.1 DUF1850 domain-containing protein [Psychrobacter sp. 5A.1]
MTNKQPNNLLGLSTGAALIAALVFCTLWMGFALQPVVEVRVTGVEGAEDKVCYFVEPDFQLRWIHSVEKQWWEEQYQRIDGSSTEAAELLLTTTYFEAFGAGTPSTEKLAPIQKPGYLGYQIDEKLPQLNWVISRLTKGEIDYGGHRFLIHQWVPDYSEVIIMPKTYGLIDRFKKDFCHDIPSDGSR